MAAAEQPDRSRRRRSSARLLSTQIGYQMRVLVRSPLSSFATLIVPLMVLLAVNLLYKGTRVESRGNIPFVQFFTPAMIAFAVANACYMSVISQITLARDEGILKRIRSTPLPSWIYMAGRIGAASIVALLSAIVVVAVGSWVYGFQMIWAAVPAVLVVLALAIFCFCSVALAVTVLVPRADSAFPVAWGTILPLCFVSDVFIPIDGAPRWLRDLASSFPLRPFADDLEAAFNPVNGTHTLQLGHLELLAVWGLLAGAFALIAFRWEPSSGHGGHSAVPVRAAFALDRVRAVFTERHEQGGPEPLQRSPRGGGSSPATLRDPSRRDHLLPTPGVERVEGPAPGEDSSVPPDAPPLAGDVSSAE